MTLNRPWKQVHTFRSTLTFLKTVSRSKARYLGALHLMQELRVLALSLVHATQSIRANVDKVFCILFHSGPSASISYVTSTPVCATDPTYKMVRSLILKCSQLFCNRTAWRTHVRPLLSRVAVLRISGAPCCAARFSACYSQSASLVRTAGTSAVTNDLQVWACLAIGWLQYSPCIPRVMMSGGVFCPAGTCSIVYVKGLTWKAQRTILSVL